MASIKISLKDSAGAILSAGAESSLQLRNWVYWKRAYSAFNLFHEGCLIKKKIGFSLDLS